MFVGERSEGRDALEGRERSVREEPAAEEQGTEVKRSI